MRRVHLIVGLLGVIAFLLTGQIMKHHDPQMLLLSPEIRMMYVSRHIYLWGAALVNLVLGLYLRESAPGWRRTLQRIGSLLILLSAVSLLMAFCCGAVARHGRSQLAKFFRPYCLVCGCPNASRRKFPARAELTVLAIIPKIGMFEYAGVAHW